MAVVPQKTLIWLYDVLKREYRDPNRAYSDLAQTLGRYTSLSPRTDVYTFENGSSALLLQFSGTLPVNFRGTPYQFPIALWFPHNFPYEAPLVYVKPTDDMLVRPGQHVAGDGRVYHHYLARWRDAWDRSSAMDFLTILTDIFAKEPPVMAKNQAPQRSSQPPPLQAGPPLPPPPVPREQPVAPSRPPTSSQPLQMPPRPPKQHEGAVSTTSPIERRPGRYDSAPPPPPPPKPPQSSDRPPSGYGSGPYQDRPPQVPANLQYTPQRQSSLRESMSPQLTYGPPQPYHAPQPQVPIPAQHSGSSQQDSRLYSSGQKLPQHQSSYGGRSGSVTQLPAVNPGSGPGPGLPPYLNQPSAQQTGPPPTVPTSPAPYQQQQQHYQQQRPPPPQQPQQQQIRPASQQFQPPYPAQSPYPQQPAGQIIPTTTAPPQKPKDQAPNLMDSPFEINLSANNPSSNLPAPPIPRNPEKDALLSHISHQLTQILHNHATQSSSALPALQSQHQALSQTLQTLSHELSSLQSLHTILTSNISHLRSSLSKSDTVIQSSRHRSSKGDIPKIDEMLTPPTVVARQLYDTVCEERGIEAAIFALQEGFVRGRIGADVWARRTRELAREGFRKRYLARKIGRGMGLDES